MTVQPEFTNEPVLLSFPDVTETEVEHVVAALRSGWVAPTGPDLLQFEEEVAARCGVPYAVGLSSGTAALHLALVGWGVGPGDVVLTSTMTFAATANAIAYTGARPHFVDCDLDSANIEPLLVEQAIEKVWRSGDNLPVLLPVDMLGKCADYEALEKIATTHGLRMLCDSAESVGATREGRPAGAAGDAAVLSFNGNKIMTTSGGGMLLTHDQALARHVRLLASQAREPVEHYEHSEIGYNYRLSNVLAALGRAQLSRLDAMMAIRRRWRAAYRELVADVPGVEIVGGSDDSEDNCWLTAIRIDPAVSGTTSREVARRLRVANIEARPLWKPMHLQPVYRRATSTITGAAQTLFEQGLTLPSGSAMTQAAFDRVGDVLSAALEAS